MEILSKILKTVVGILTILVFYAGKSLGIATRIITKLIVFLYLIMVYILKICRKYSKHIMLVALIICVFMFFPYLATYMNHVNLNTNAILSLLCASLFVLSLTFFVYVCLAYLRQITSNADNISRDIKLLGKSKIHAGKSEGNVFEFNEERAARAEEAEKLQNMGILKDEMLNEFIEHGYTTFDEDKE